MKRNKGEYECPLGIVRISNYCWRHLTRITRTNSHVKDSLTILPYVKRFLRIKPHQLQTLSSHEEEIGNSKVINRKVLAIYRDVRFSDRGRCVVYVRLNERIEYPSDWLEYGMIRRSVKQDLILESIYRKT